MLVTIGLLHCSICTIGAMLQFLPLTMGGLIGDEAFEAAAGARAWHVADISTALELGKV